MPDPETSAVLKKVRPRLAEALGSRLHGVVLYGSEARGQAEPDSDIDLLVLLEGPIDLVKDIETVVRALYPLQLEIPERAIHALPVDVQEFEAAEFFLYQNVKREGVWL